MRKLWRVALHIFEGSVMFALITVAAVCLHLLIQWAESKQVPPVIVYGLIGADYALFAADLIFFGNLLVKSLWTAFKETWNEQ